MPSKLLRIGTLVLGLTAAAPAVAEKPPELVGAPEAQTKVGETAFRVMFWTVFDASLWSANPSFDWTSPFALSLTYARDFTAEQLTEKTVEEMARLSRRPESAFYDFGKTFNACVSDVGEGDRITAVSRGPDTARLYLNGDMRCELEAPGLRESFFGIWLSRDSLFPEATAKLIGADDGSK